MREQITELKELALLNAHKDDVWKNLGLPFLVFWGVSESLEHDVGLETIENLVVTEVRVLWQVEDGLLLALLIVLVVENLDESLSDEIHLLDITLVADDSLAWGVDSAVHVDDQLICETSLALLKEVIERSLELLENSCILNQVSLHLWGDLLVELKLLNDQVEIIEESLFNILSDVVVESGLDVEWLV